MVFSYSSLKGLRQWTLKKNCTVVFWLFLTLGRNTKLSMCCYFDSKMAVCENLMVETGELGFKYLIYTSYVIIGSLTFI